MLTVISGILFYQRSLYRGSTVILLNVIILMSYWFILVEQNKEINKSLMQANRKVAKLEQQLMKSKVKCLL